MQKIDLVRIEEKAIHDEYYWLSDDNVELYGQIWKSTFTPKAIIILLHSFGEHSNRYNTWAKKFLNSGYFVAAIDFRSHGKSKGEIKNVSSFLKLIKDLETLLQKSENMFPNIPKILYGQGLGGNLAIYYLISHISNLNGLIIASPFLELKLYPHKIKLAFLNFLKYLFPKYTISYRINPNYLSKIPEIVEDYKKDPLIHHKINIKLLVEILKTGNKIAKKIYKINMPILLMHGTDDGIASNKTNKDFILYSSKKTTLKEWTGYYHELHNDKNNEEIFQFIIEWLDKQFNRYQPSYN